MELIITSSLQRNYPKKLEQQNAADPNMVYCSYCTDCYYQRVTYHIVII